MICSLDLKNCQILGSTIFMQNTLTNHLFNAEKEFVKRSKKILSCPWPMINNDHDNDYIIIKFKLYHSFLHLLDKIKNGNALQAYKSCQTNRWTLRQPARCEHCVFFCLFEDSCIVVVL